MLCANSTGLVATAMVIAMAIRVETERSFAGMGVGCAVAGEWETVGFYGFAAPGASGMRAAPVANRTWLSTLRSRTRALPTVAHSCAPQPSNAVRPL